MKRIILILISLSAQPAFAGHAVATAHPLATEAGAKILQAGGNAFDAAVAISATLAVVEPYSSGLGGGGFYLIYNNKTKKYVFIDARERAPLAASRDMYLDDDGEIIEALSIDGALSAAIPGIPAALEHLSSRYGALDLKTLLEPAINAASQGFAADRILLKMIGFRKTVLERHRTSRAVFLKGSRVPELGEMIIQDDLARSLRTIANKGVFEFYRGKIARELVRSVRAEGGIWSKEDLSSYRIIEREPIKWQGQFGQLYSAPPPSSGGVALAQIMAQLEQFMMLDHFDSDNTQHQHLLIEAMRRAYRDRAVYLGDPDFVEMPLTRLLSHDYAAGLAASIHPDRASKSDWFKIHENINPGSSHTTHFSVRDSHGNIVSATLSINYPFGSCMIAGNTGILLNDEMDDFVAKPGTQNAYGLVGLSANAIEPGKRMLSSMSPTILRLPDRSVVLGTPGGSRIITMVAQGMLAAITGANAQAIADSGRIHHQFIPDTVYAEPSYLSAELINNLTDMGHELSVSDSTWGNMHVIVIDADGKVEAASDNRGIGKAWIVNTAK